VEINNFDALYNVLCRAVKGMKVKSKGVPRQAEVAQGLPGRLRSRILSTFGTTRVVGRQPYASAAFTPGEIRGTHFQRLSRPQGTWFCQRNHEKKSSVTSPGIDYRTVRLVAQCLNQYSTLGPQFKELRGRNCKKNRRTKML